MRNLMRLSSPGRLARVALGAGALTYYGFFPGSTWALLGVIPLLTGLVNACPLYLLRRRRPEASEGSPAGAEHAAGAAAEEAMAAAPERSLAPARSGRPLQRGRKKMKRQSPVRRPRSEPVAAGQVSKVTDGNFESQVLAAEEPVLVDFWAEWCGPCKAMAPVLDQVADQLGGRARVAKLDVERNPRTAERFGIRNIPTMILFNKGEVADILVGMQSKDKLVRLLSRAA